MIPSVCFDSIPMFAIPFPYFVLPRSYSDTSYRSVSILLPTVHSHYLSWMTGFHTSRPSSFHFPFCQTLTLHSLGAGMRQGSCQCDEQERSTAGRRLPKHKDTKIGRLTTTNIITKCSQLLISFRCRSSRKGLRKRVFMTIMSSLVYTFYFLSFIRLDLPSVPDTDPRKNMCTTFFFFF